MTTTALLRFTDEPTAIAALAQYRDTQGWITGSHAHALDPVGTLYTPVVLNPDGTVKTPAVALPGWHVNLIGALPAAAEPARMGPVTPKRLYAGSSWAQAAPQLTGNVTPGLYQDTAGVAWIVIQAYNASVYTDPTVIPALARKLRVPGAQPWAQPIDQYDAYRVMDPYTGQPDECTDGGKTWRTTLDFNVWKPGTQGAGWVDVDDPNAVLPPPVDEWPEFVQPTGAQDAYAKGAQVAFNGEHYISLIDANVWSPAAYAAGWSKAARSVTPP